MIKLAFYYHIPISLCKNNTIAIPSYLGVFIDALANEVEHLTLVMHEANSREAINCDYKVKSCNITWINLGYKTPSWHRALAHKKLLKNKLKELLIDYFLIRSPSPLAPYFHRYIPQHKIRFLIVGDYESGSLRKKSIRNIAIDYYIKFNSYLFKKAIQNTPILVNSPALFDKYKDLATSCKLVGTTTLSKQDFFERVDTCTGNVVRLLYTGRIDLQKGLLELVNVTGELINEGGLIELHLVGWEDNLEKPIETFLKSKAREMDISDKVVFHGKKKVGQELNQFYRMADIYVIPSYHEGFPRTIWEAMANSLPIIATAVGGIPRFLSHEEHALIITSKDEGALKNAIIRLKTDSDLRKTLIKNGRDLAANQILEILTKELVKSIH
ncbi:glycosyltransferase family 4 protein [Flavobacterium sp.]|uniref:glycosyltransferase family 4 protein n=1 Tax=Flavobacterium sp. TaxID=239 RepID=UPI0037C132A6